MVRTLSLATRATARAHSSPHHHPCPYYILRLRCPSTFVCIGSSLHFIVPAICLLNVTKSVTRNSIRHSWLRFRATGFTRVCVGFLRTGVIHHAPRQGPDTISQGVMNHARTNLLSLPSRRPKILRAPGLLLLVRSHTATKLSWAPYLHCIIKAR